MVVWDESTVLRVVGDCGVVWIVWFRVGVDVLRWWVGCVQETQRLLSEPGMSAALAEWRDLCCVE